MFTVRPWEQDHLRIGMDIVVKFELALDAHQKVLDVDKLNLGKGMRSMIS